MVERLACVMCRELETTHAQDKLFERHAMKHSHRRRCRGVSSRRVSVLGRSDRLNARANKRGLLTAQVVDNNAGHGTFSVPYLRDTRQCAMRIRADRAGSGTRVCRYSDGANVQMHFGG
jgi:hypothetical protein